MIGHLTDGSKIEGILEGTDDQHVIMMTPEEVESQETYDERQPYGYRPRYRRFFRRRFPFPFYLFAFPFIVPYPFLLLNDVEGIFYPIGIAYQYSNLVFSLSYRWRDQKGGSNLSRLFKC
ncbi:hypothetical protein QS257_12995 [Terrilactibacillus sp. S3-3]|nr:hypothetical protein QS257_12995 [Terrilactibacillus sp. S3-3]